MVVSVIDWKKYDHPSCTMATHVGTHETAVFQAGESKSDGACFLYVHAFGETHSLGRHDNRSSMMKAAQEYATGRQGHWII
jgi:hypothetical protein